MLWVCTKKSVYKLQKIKEHFKQWENSGLELYSEAYTPQLQPLWLPALYCLVNLTYSSS